MSISEISFDALDHRDIDCLHITLNDGRVYYCNTELTKRLFTWMVTFVRTQNFLNQIKNEHPVDYQRLVEETGIENSHSPKLILCKKVKLPKPRAFGEINELRI